MLKRAFIQLTVETSGLLDRIASANYHLTRTPTTSIEAWLKRLYELPLYLSLVCIFACVIAATSKGNLFVASLDGTTGEYTDSGAPIRTRKCWSPKLAAMAVAHRICAALSRLSRHEVA
jgi:hypothetical protein